MSGILRLESLTKGNTLKQGDKTPLKYRLFDADGENLNIAGKSAQVRLVYPDFLTIGYEKDGLTVAQDDTVTFTIDSVVPSRIYHVEIIVDDKYVFPSRADESKFTVDKSSLGTEANIIEIVGVDALVKKAVDLINKDPNLIIDEDKLVSDIISNSGIGNINEYYKAFNDLKPRAELSISKSAEALTKSQNALNVANGIDAKATNALSLSESADTLSKSVQEQFNQVVIDGDSSVEAAQARVDASGQTNPTLKARLDKEHNEVTAQLAKKVTKNRGEITSADLSQEVKEQMTGGSVAVVGKNAVNTENIIDGAVNPDKLSSDMFKLFETIKMENLVKNASLENLNSWESRLADNVTVNNGIISFTANGAAGNVYTAVSPNRETGDKYYVSAQVKTTGPNARILLFGDSQDSTNIVASGSGEWERKSFIYEIKQNGDLPLFFRIADYATSNWQEISMTKPLVVNLTDTFGKGKEPNIYEFEEYIHEAGLTDYFFTGTFRNTKLSPSAISDSSLNQPEASENYCVVNSDKIDFAFKDKTRDLKIGMGKRGPNQIFDFTSVEENINSLPSINTNFSDYTPVLITSTDWFGPYIVKANNSINGDNIDSGNFTGGNHGYDNSGTTVGNSSTGRTTSVEFYVDGYKKESYNGSFNRLKIIWTNRVQGYNTTKVDGSGREILEETIRAEISNGKMDIFSEIKALEDITIETYYGLQTVFRENEQTYQFIGGANRGIYQSEIVNSEDKSATGIILRGILNLKMTIDPTVGIGNNQLTSYPTYSFRRGGQKMYGNLIRGDFNLPENNVLYYAGQYDFTV